MKSLRCRIGIHREYLVEAFPVGSPAPLIVGVQCIRCKRYRCVAQRIPSWGDDVEPAFDQAQLWLEKNTGRRVFGSFVQIT